MAITWNQVITSGEDTDYLNSNVDVGDLGGGSGSTFLRKDGNWATPTDTNTTYSVGDGGLTQKNFTTTLKNKLDGIATSATNVTNNNQITNGAGYITSQSDTQDLSIVGHTISLTDGGSVVVPDNNTTYVEATGSVMGLMSTAHHDKLDGIQGSADAYSSWKIKANSGSTTSVNSGNTVAFIQGGATTVSRSGNDITISSTDNNTTYSVGDGGLTQKNFTTTLKNKLDGIATSATNVTNNNQLTNGAGYITTQSDTQDLSIVDHTISLTDGGSVVVPDNNTTYSVGDGGLTQKNFTTTLKNKLDGVASSATNVTNNNQISNGAGYITGYTNTVDMGSGFRIGNSGGTSQWAVTEDDTLRFAGIGATSVAFDSSTEKITISSTDNNTTYSVGDGGLTQKNFTTTLKNKLDGIASSATNVTNNNQLTNGAGYITTQSDTQDLSISGHTLSLTNSPDVTLPDNDTTYSVGDGGLTQKNFTTTLKNKLDGIASSATNVSNNNQISNGAGYITSYVNTVDMGAGFKIANSGNTAQFTVTESESIRVAGSGATSVAFDSGTQKITISSTDNNTTYSVGDGGLTQKNFTTTLKNKLDGIASSATNVTNNNQITNGAGYITSQTDAQTLSINDHTITISGSSSSVVVPDNNTTYSEATGIAMGLMSTAHHDKLDGIAVGATKVNNNNQIANGAGYVTSSGTNTTYTHNIKSGTTKLDLIGSDTTNDLVEFVGGTNVTVTRTDGDTLTFASTDTNTTYSVGDGGLTQKNFTTTLKNKLDGIAGSATNVTNNNQISNGAGYITSYTNTVDMGSGFRIGNSGGTAQFTITEDDTFRIAGSGATTVAFDSGTEKLTISSTDNNTTYSVGDGGLTQKNFTTTLKNKLDGIASSATNVTNNNQLTNGAGYITAQTDTQDLSISGQTLSLTNSPDVTLPDTNTTYTAGTNMSLSGTEFSATDTNTTYSVGDGGLTQKNFTTTLKSKLDGIASSATNVTNNNQISNGAGYITSYTNTVDMGSGFKVANSGGTAQFTVTEDEAIRVAGSGATSVAFDSGTQKITISSTDNNTTYSVGDGGLTQKNFTTTLKTKLDGIASSATNVSNNNQITNGAGYITSYVNTTYSAGSGLDLNTTTFSVEPDLRDGITHVGLDTGDYITWNNNTATAFFINGSNEFLMEADGDFHADGDVFAFSSIIASDKRLKTDIEELTGNLDNIMNLEPVKFDWLVKDKGVDIGLIAQDVQKVVPEVVKEVDSIGKTAEFLDNDTMLTVDYAKLVPVLIGAIQELKEEINELKRNR